MGSRDRVGPSPIDVRRAPTTQPDLKPREVCGATPSAVSGVTCIREPGHAGAHRGSAGHKWLSPKRVPGGKPPISNHPPSPRNRVHVTNSAETHAAIARGDEPGALARIMADPEEGVTGSRIAAAGAAVALLEQAAKLASAARTELILAGCGASHPGVAASARAVGEIMKAEQGARHALAWTKRGTK